MSGLYQAFRENGAPTYYAPNQTPWMADILEAGLIFAFCILAFSFYVILPGIRGKEGLYTFIRVTLSLYIGAVIILANFSYTWDTAEIHTRTKYRAGTGREITADIGVHIGLRGINITLKGTPESQLNETINYNEHFSWEWEQGRLGFGPFAGRFNQEYRAAQFRGLPLPILWIAEYFTFDGEGIRWGRHYRQAGWFSHIMLWLSFPLWLLTNILFFVLLRYGAYFLFMTGTSMVISNVIWATLRNVNPLQIPFEDGTMTFSYGGSFYICLITGVLCMILAVVIRILDLRFPTQLVAFFGVDVLQDTDDVIEEDEDDEPKKPVQVGDIELAEISNNGPRAPPMRPPAAERAPIPTPDQHRTAEVGEDGEERNEEELYEIPEAPTQSGTRYQRRKSRGLTMKFQKSRRRRPPPPPVEDDQEEMYENSSFDVGGRDVRVRMQ